MPGYHLKSVDGMNGMKYDMCGAAEMMEMLEYLAVQSRKNVMAVLMLAENVISPDAVKMGDVITTLAGKTVEVYNVDAEGRLVLCDGITFAQRMGARTVIDLATLTYSAQSALGDQVVALFGNDREALRIWEETAEQTGEYYWQLPMGPIYHKMIEWSICADFANYAPGKGQVPAWRHVSWKTLWKMEHSGSISIWWDRPWYAKKPMRWQREPVERV